MRALVLLLACLAVELRRRPWTLQESGTKARLRGVSAVSRDVAWASGSQGTVLTDDRRRCRPGRQLVVPDSADARLPRRPGLRRPRGLPCSRSAPASFRGSTGRSTAGSTLDPPAHQPRPERIPRCHRLLGRRPRPRPRRPGRRPLRDPGHRRRRQDLDEDPRRRDAPGLARRRGLRGERDLPGRRRGHPTPGSAPAEGPRPGSSARPTGGGPGPSPTPRSGREIPLPGVFSLAFRDALTRPRRRRRLQARGRPGREPRDDLRRRPDLDADREGSSRRVPLGRRVRARPRGPSVVAVGPSGSDLSTDGGELVEAGRTRLPRPRLRSGREAGWAVGEAGRIGKLDTPCQSVIKLKNWSSSQQGEASRILKFMSDGPRLLLDSTLHCLAFNSASFPLQRFEVGQHRGQVVGGEGVEEPLGHDRQLGLASSPRCPSWR